MNPPPNEPNGRIDGMRPVLFPMRMLLSTAGNDGSNGGSNGAIGDAMAVRWVGMSPLQLVQMLAGTTEQREAASGLAFRPMRVDDVALSEPNAALSLSANAKKRSRSTADDDDDDSLVLPIEHGAPPLPPWDPSFLLCYDIHALPTVERLQTLARTLESMSHSNKVMPSYRRVRDHLANTSGWIHNHCNQTSATIDDAGANEQSRLLSILYNETIQKMEALIDMAQNLADAEAAARVVANQSVAAAAATTKPDGKKDFAEYMQQWLKDNWTNPYPDDDGLAEIAQDCDTTKNVVGNWLINARTRKWRPAIVKAYELSRPADMLLEDSINIFEGKPVREIEGYPSVPPEMSQPPSAKRRKNN
jgi:hypothetical protein